jgi:arginine decarboxylase
VIPKYFFLTKGVGKHKENLSSFELALRDAGIQHCNIVTVSSIIPPGARMIPREKGIQMLQPGEVTFVVLARNSTDEPHRLIAASVGAAIPSEESQYGYLSEHHSNGQTEEIAGDYTEDLAATMLATTMGLAFDPQTAWDERKQLFQSSGLIIKTTSITQSATGDKSGLWTSVVAAAVFLPPTAVLPQTSPAPAAADPVREESHQKTG